VVKITDSAFYSAVRLRASLAFSLVLKNMSLLQQHASEIDGHTAAPHGGASCAVPAFDLPTSPSPCTAKRINCRPVISHHQEEEGASEEKHAAGALRLLLSSL
jgi:hypothetical protein